MGRASLRSTHGDPKMSTCWSRSAIPAWGCLQTRPTRSSMLSLPPSLMGRAWGYPLATPSFKRMVDACGLATTLRAAQVLISLYPLNSRHMNEAWRPSHGFGMLHKQITSELGTSEITVTIHPEDGPEFYASEMRKLLDPLLFTPERSIML